MYGILGEDKSDVATLKVLIRRLERSDSIPVKTKGYDGCGEMLRKGAKQLRLFTRLGCNRFVVCYDSDGEEPNARYHKIVESIIRPSGLTGLREIICILIPVQEIEAWILADIEAVSNIIKSWHPKPIYNPETINILKSDSHA